MTSLLITESVCIGESTIKFTLSIKIVMININSSNGSTMCRFVFYMIQNFSMNILRITILMVN